MGNDHGTHEEGKSSVKMSYNDGNTGGVCMDSADTNTYNLRLFSWRLHAFILLNILLHFLHL